MNLNFGFIPIASQFIKTEDELLKIAGKYFSDLNKIGAERWNEKNLSNVNPLVYFIITGGTERLLLNLFEKRKIHVKDEPIFIIAHPTHNSLPASLEILAKLNQEGINGRIFYLSSQNKNEVKKIVKAISNNLTKKLLEISKIGLIGEPSDWLVASSPNSNIIKKVWGPEIVPIAMDEVTNIIQNIDKNDIVRYFDSLVKNAKSINEPTTVDIENNIKIYLALKFLRKKYELDALTIRCFDLVLNIKTTGCFGLSQLNDDGFIAGCEGDLVSTIGMLWSYKLLNQIPWMANPVQLDESKNTLWLAHCTVPRSIVNNYNLRSHFESGIGVGIQGFISNGPITLFRIGGKNMEKLWTAEGEIIQTGNSEHLCRTQVEIKLTKGNVAELLNNPLGNHLILVKEHFSKTLIDYYSNFILK
jgi:L-fucose isomerase-like protein